MKKLMYLFVLLTMSVLFMSEKGCNDNTSSNAVLAQKQEILMQEANRQVGMPNIKNFQERKLLKMILELRDQENLVCYAYIVAEMTGKLVYIGKCIGFGIPYSTEYTNPAITVEGRTQGEFTTLPQADPNGLFMPPSAEGTWLMMVDPNNNEPRPVYIEPRVIVSPFKLQ
jgi:hypothetical protein